MLSEWLTSPTFHLWLDRFVVPLDDPGSRLFHLNLTSSLILIVVFALWNRKPLGNLLQHSLFRRRYWWNRSTRIDYQIYVLNSLFKVFLFIPFFDFSFRLSQGTARALLSWQGDFQGFSPTWGALVLFTVAAFVWDDFLRFFHHYLMHRFEFLWAFHQTHHSARILTPVTLYRTHPVESALATLRNSLSLGLTAGLFVFLFQSPLGLFTFLGVNLFGFVFNFLGSNLRHSHIPLSFGVFERLFISPKMHQIHHSRRVEDFDRNFGVSLSIWDGLWGTRLLSAQGPSRIRMGLAMPHARSLVPHLWTPFSHCLCIFKTLSSAIRKFFILKASWFFISSKGSSESVMKPLRKGQPS